MILTIFWPFELSYFRHFLFYLFIYLLFLGIVGYRGCVINSSQFSVDAFKTVICCDIVKMCMWIFDADEIDRITVFLRL